jgi:exodeoxyribonuclease VII large subunit
MELFDDRPRPPGNTPEFTVSELSGAVKRVIETEFGFVRVRGEVSRVSRPASGHLYFDLKDDRSVLGSVCWKGQAARLAVRPEEGMEVVATGRLTTFPGQSKYQLVIDSLEPAGAGALMLMLEKRKAALAAEGLFAADRKRPIPFLPDVIGVVTSPSGAVIRDILHRLRDRFPRRVLIWPVAVQGEKCAPEVAAAIRGFNALEAGGPVPRPDVLIVARGGGSIEDLWGFNEEIVVRAAAASAIPLISAVGHETDTTLIDFAADRRAPTPTAAAEMAVPVRLELIARNEEAGARLARAVARDAARRGDRLRGLARALPRVDSLTQGAAQALDLRAGRLAAALAAAAARKRRVFAGLGAKVQPALLAGFFAAKSRALLRNGTALDAAATRRLDRLAARVAGEGRQLAPALARLIGAAAREAREARDRLAALDARRSAAQSQRFAALADRLAALDRMRQTLGYAETLTRGYAVVRGDGAVVTSRTAAEAAAALEIEFRDGRLALGPRAGKRPKGREDGGQGSLF